MKTRVIWGFVACVSLLALVVGLSQAQEPELAGAPLGQGEREGEESVQPMDTVTAEWRQRLGQDGQDNFRVQRRPSSSGSWVTLLALSKDGNLTLKGNKVCLGGNCNYRLQKSGTAVELYASNRRALRLEGSGISPNVIGGHISNTVTSGVYGATIGGGGDSDFPNRVTSSYGTVGGGRLNTASNDSATVGGGNSNAASGFFATIGGGFGNTASSEGATVSGGWNNTASADYATVPGGVDARATHYGEMAYASGCFGTPGQAQTSLYVLRRATLDATPAELFLDSSSQRLTVASNRTMTFDILVVARSAGAASAGYRFYGVIENAGGNTAFIGTPEKTILGEDVTSWDANVLADTTNNALVIQVTGTSTTVLWVATVRTVEVAY